MSIVQFLAGVLLVALGVLVILRRQDIRRFMDRQDFSFERRLATLFRKDAWNYEGRVREVQIALPALLILMGVLLLLAAFL